jgi:hypothetical protein
MPIHGAEVPLIRKIVLGRDRDRPSIARQRKQSNTENRD